jgi:hypothetical protein
MGAPLFLDPYRLDLPPSFAINFYCPAKQYKYIFNPTQKSRENVWSDFGINKIRGNIP